MAKNTGSYIARCKKGCGGIVFATVDIPEHAEDVARDVAEMIANGYTIEHVTVGYVHENGFGCKCVVEEIIQPELFSEMNDAKT